MSTQWRRLRLCCTLLQCIAVYCSVLPCDDYSVTAFVAVLQCVAVLCCSALQCCVAVCCSVLQSIAACCSVLQCIAVWRLLGDGACSCVCSTPAPYFLRSHTHTHSRVMCHSGVRLRSVCMTRPHKHTRTHTLLLGESVCGCVCDTPCTVFPALKHIHASCHSVSQWVALCCRELQCVLSQECVCMPFPHTHTHILLLEESVCGCVYGTSAPYL